MTLEALIAVVIYIIVAGAICWLLWWLVTYLGIPEPFAKIARGIIAVVGVLVLITLLLQIAGVPFRLPR